MRVLPFVLFLTLALPAGAGFVSPDETKVLFRRDLLPIDADTMRVLSAQLTELARRENQKAPAQLRATAQLLAIASRLDPVNHRARGIGKRLSEGLELNPSSPAALRRAKSETWHLVDWLLHKDAGAEGQLLGNQLVDALRIIDPKHPAAARYHPEGEAARWEGVVAPLKAFQPKQATAEDSQNRETAKATPPKPDPPEQTFPAPSILQRTHTLASPLLVSGPDDTHTPMIVPLSVQIRENELAGRFEFQFEPALESALQNRVIARTRAPLVTLWKTLPPQNEARISVDGQTYHARNGTALAGPVALTIHAALEGKVLRDDLVFIGEPQVDGSLVSPACVWELLAAVRQGPGGRLLVPPDLLDHLRALLVLEEPDFFIRYEVLSVPDLATALQLGSTGGDPEPLVEITPQFEELRRIARTGSIGVLAANRHVRDRLEPMCEAVPNHLSARMLLLQGSVQRPTRLPLATLQQELIRCLSPMNRIIWSESEELTAKSLDQSYDDCRQRLKEIEAYVEIKHRPLREEALDMTRTLRTLARTRKTGWPTSEFIVLHARLQGDLQRFLKRLASPAKVAPGPSFRRPRS